MKKTNVLLFLLVVAIAASLFAGGGSAGGSSGGSGGPTPITLSWASRPVFDPELPSVQEIMRLTNTTVQVVLSENTVDSRNLMFASGDLPDIIQMTGLDFLQYLSTGYFRPLDDLLPTYAPNIWKNTSADGWKFMTVQGKIYAYPYEANRIKHYAYVRSDWLDNLGIDLSRNQDYGNFGGKVITVDEYRDILIKFTRNDPDKNGRNDTYGMGATARKTNFDWNNIYGAFGGIPGHYYEANGRVIPWIVTDQYRQGLQYLNSLWREGVIDPEIFLNNNDQARQKMINSVSGSVVGEWWSSAHTLQVDGLQALVPDAEFIPIWLTSNDGKTFGSPDNGLISNTWSISTTSKNPEKALSFCDFFNDDAGYYWAWYGLEGLDYTMVDGYPQRTEAGLTKYNNMVIDPFFSLSNRLDLQNRAARRPVFNWTELLRQKWEILQHDNSQPSYASIFYGIPSPVAYGEYGVDVNNWIEQSAMAFITGETPLTDANWNNYINTWRRMGGVRILQGYIDSYNSINGTRLTAGITE